MNQVLVLHVVPDLRRAAGGIAAVLPALCEALKEEGVESQVVAFAQDEDSTLAKRTLLLEERTPWKLACRMHSESVRWRDEARRTGRRFVCHSHGLWGFLNHGLVAAARNERIPLVISLHGMLLPWARRHKAFRKTIAWRLYQAQDLTWADVVHVTSDDERVAAEEAGATSQFAVIPLGVDMQLMAANPSVAVGEFTPTEASPERTLLFLGRMHPVKNIDGLIKAFAQVRPEGWRLRIVGPDDGGHRAGLEQLAIDCGVAGRINFEEPAFGEAKTRLFEQTDLLILPSHSENFGVVVAEALAHGVPAIASAGTPWSALQTERCGWWVESDRDSLSAALHLALKCPPEELIAMGLRGQVYVETNLTWPVCARAMAALYQHSIEISSMQHFTRPSADDVPSSMQPS